MSARLSKRNFSRRKRFSHDGVHSAACWSLHIYPILLRPCSPSREEFAHGEEQARKREYDEHDLVDVLFAGRQSAYEVRCPEDRVIP